MNEATTVAQTLANLAILAGCVLALVTAFEPQPTGAWRLAGTWLFCGLVPYVVYGSFTTITSGCSLLVSGVLLFGTDVVACATLGFTAAASPDPLAPVRFVTVLVLVVLPAGLLAGKLLGQQFICRAGINNPDKPG